MVVVVLELEVDRGGDAGVGEDLLGLLGARLAVAVAVGGLQRVIVTGQAVRMKEYIGV